MARSVSLRSLIAFIVLSAAALAFLVLGSEMLEGETHDFDRWLLLALRTPNDIGEPIGPAWVEQAMLDMTALGGMTVLTLVTLATAGFLRLTRKQREAWFLVGSVSLGLAVSSALKAAYGRPRPDFIPHNLIIATLSFPSGHAMMSAIVYLTLGVLLARAQPDRRVKIYIVALAAFMTVTIGISRIYLAVHWPTDVIAGWIVGAAWAVLSWTGMSWIQKHG